MLAKGAAAGLDAKEIGALFGKFSECEFAILDERRDAEKDAIGWEALEVRVGYVLKQREAFCSVKWSPP